MVRCEFCIQFTFRAGIVTLIEQYKTIGGVYTAGKCLVRQRGFVSLRCLSKYSLLGKSISYERVPISRVGMSRPEKSGVRFQLIQITHAKMEPRLRVGGS